MIYQLLALHLLLSDFQSDDASTAHSSATHTPLCKATLCNPEGYGVRNDNALFPSAKDACMGIKLICKGVINKVACGSEGGRLSINFLHTPLPLGGMGYQLHLRCMYGVSS